jgi:hypothetical protein
MNSMYLRGELGKKWSVPVWKQFVLTGDSMLLNSLAKFEQCSCQFRQNCFGVCGCQTRLKYPRIALTVDCVVFGFD